MSPLSGRTIDLRAGAAFAPRELLLTFDDGPHPRVTPQVLTPLANYGLRGVFFMIGNAAKAYPATARQVRAPGHLVGSHTRSHPDLPTLTDADARREIAEGHRLVSEALAPDTADALFRFPYLSLTPALQNAVRMQGLNALSAGIVARDWEEQTVDHLVDFALAEIDRIGSGIIVLHDIHDRTAAALPRILAALETDGCRILTPTFG